MAIITAGGYTLTVADGLVEAGEAAVRKYLAENVPALAEETIRVIKGPHAPWDAWKAPFRVEPVSLLADGARSYEYRIVDADGFTFATTSFEERARMIALLPDLLGVLSRECLLQVSMSTCDHCLDSDLGVCDEHEQSHSQMAAEISTDRWELLSKLQGEVKA